MNYPIWSLPAKGLLIAFVGIVHVFVSHFAVGGGLFLALAERKARREGDTLLLAYVRLHSRFLVLLTLVTGAVTGVGIWFTIGVVHPDATSALITAFVWAWAIEWVFFAVEIAAALVYYYGWDRLDARTHLAVAWVYFVAAWSSLAVINGILSFMLVPGPWLRTHSLLHGLLLNPTYVPSLVLRTAIAVGLAGLYALLTAAWQRDITLWDKVSRYAGRWVAVAAVVLPFAVASYAGVAFLAGVPIGEPLGAPGEGLREIIRVLARGSVSGNPAALRAVQVVFAAAGCTLALALVATRRRPRRSRRPLAVAVLLSALTAMGAGEWVREDLRKPYVIGEYMFVNGVRAGESLPKGVLAAARWRRAPSLVPPSMPSEREGEEVFRLVCSPCHTIDGYRAIRPLVRGRSREALEATLAHLDTWRGRRMPPFAGNEDERRQLSAFLEFLGRTR